MKNTVLICISVLVLFSACSSGEKDKADITDLAGKTTDDLDEIETAIDQLLVQLSEKDTDEARHDIFVKLAKEILKVKDEDSRLKVKQDVKERLREIATTLSETLIKKEVEDSATSGGDSDIVVKDNSYKTDEDPEITFDYLGDLGELSEKNPDLKDMQEELNKLAQGVAGGMTDEERNEIIADLALKMTKIGDEEIKAKLKEKIEENAGILFEDLEEGEAINIEDLGFVSAGDCLLTVELVEEYCHLKGKIALSDGVVGMCAFGLTSNYGMPVVSFATQPWTQEMWELLSEPPYGVVYDTWDVENVGEQAMGVDMAAMEVYGEALSEESLLRQKSLYVKNGDVIHGFHPKVYNGEGCTFEQAVDLARAVLK